MPRLPSRAGRDARAVSRMAPLRVHGDAPRPFGKDASCRSPLPLLRAAPAARVNQPCRSGGSSRRTRATRCNIGPSTASGPLADRPVQSSVTSEKIAGSRAGRSLIGHSGRSGLRACNAVFQRAAFRREAIPPTLSSIDDRRERTPWNRAPRKRLRCPRNEMGSCPALRGSIAPRGRRRSTRQGACGPSRALAIS
jgi:hypothetical protein